MQVVYRTDAHTVREVERTLMHQHSPPPRLCVCADQWCTDIYEVRISPTCTHYAHVLSKPHGVNLPTAHSCYSIGIKTVSTILRAQLNCEDGCVISLASSVSFPTPTPSSSPFSYPSLSSVMNISSGMVHRPQHQHTLVLEVQVPTVLLLLHTHLSWYATLFPSPLVGILVYT
jgi:hypothetical protein